MSKIYSKVYHLKGSGTMCGTMVCSQCQKKIDSYTQDWLEAKKNYQGDWGFVSFHRECYPKQEGWEKIEKQIKKDEKGIENIVEDLGRYKDGNGNFDWKFCEALSRIGLEVE